MILISSSLSSYHEKAAEALCVRRIQTRLGVIAFVSSFPVEFSTDFFNLLLARNSAMDWWLRAFALEADRLGSILSRVKPKTLKLVSAVTLAKRSAIKCSAEDKMNGE